MNTPKTKLSDFTKRSLNNRITSAERQIYDMKEELARREKIARYGTETPELSELNIAVEVTFWLTVQAKDEADATTVVDETGWPAWYHTTPGQGIRVDNYWVESDDPLPVGLVEEWRRDAAERMKKIEATEQIVSADVTIHSVH